MHTMHAMMKPGIVLIIQSIFYFSIGNYAHDFDPIKNMCVRFDHQSAIKNNTLYIDGGKESFIDITDNGEQVGNITTGYNNYVIRIDLSKPWDWTTNISEIAILKNAQPNTGVTTPVLSRGALFQGTPNDNNIYLWGGTTSYTNTSFPGFRPPNPAAYSLWGYDIHTEQWSHFDVTKGSPNRPSSASYGEAPEQGLGFFFNGELDSGSSTETQVFGDAVKMFIEGMIVVDTKNHTAKNISTSQVSAGFPRSRGRMQYVSSVGERGALIQIGGNRKATNETENTYIGDLVPMDQIDVFDIAAMFNTSTPDGKWYKQTATGDIPERRLDSCLVLASAPDNSSHNIYMYGGRGASLTYFDDIHILSLPSFIWTKVYDGASPRFEHTCHRAGSRTMLTVGGTNAPKFTDATCDWQKRGVNVLDMSTITWGSVYSPHTAPYTVPKPVVDKIGGTENGNATMKAPVGGFDQPGLAAMFNQPVRILPRRSFPSAFPAIIAGGVVGGTALVVALITISWYYGRRLRRFIVGSNIDPHLEIDGLEKNEIMTERAFCELDTGEKIQRARYPQHSIRIFSELDASEDMKRAAGDQPDQKIEVHVTATELSDEPDQPNTPPKTEQRRNADRQRRLSPFPKILRLKRSEPAGKTEESRNQSKTQNRQRIPRNSGSPPPPPPQQGPVHTPDAAARRGILERRGPVRIELIDPPLTGLDEESDRSSDAAAETA